jgi:hypothetical protein
MSHTTAGEKMTEWFRPIICCVLCVWGCRVYREKSPVYMCAAAAALPKTLQGLSKLSLRSLLSLYYASLSSGGSIKDGRDPFFFPLSFSIDIYIYIYRIFNSLRQPSLRGIHIREAIFIFIVIYFEQDIISSPCYMCCIVYIPLSYKVLRPQKPTLHLQQTTP